MQNKKFYLLKKKPYYLNYNSIKNIVVFRKTRKKYGKIRAIFLNTTTKERSNYNYEHSLLKYKSYNKKKLKRKSFFIEKMSQKNISFFSKKKARIKNLFVVKNTKFFTITKFNRDLVLKKKMLLERLLLWKRKNKKSLMRREFFYFILRTIFFFNLDFANTKKLFDFLVKITTFQHNFKMYILYKKKMHSSIRGTSFRKHTIAKNKKLRNEILLYKKFIIKKKFKLKLNEQKFVSFYELHALKNKIKYFFNYPKIMKKLFYLKCFSFKGFFFNLKKKKNYHYNLNFSFFLFSFFFYSKRYSVSKLFMFKNNFMKKSIAFRNFFIKKLLSYDLKNQTHIHFFTNFQKMKKRIQFLSTFKLYNIYFIMNYIKKKKQGKKKIFKFYKCKKNVHINNNTNLKNLLLFKSRSFFC